MAKWQAQIHNGDTAIRDNKTGKIVIQVNCKSARNAVDGLVFHKRFHPPGAEKEIYERLDGPQIGGIHFALRDSLTLEEIQSADWTW